MNYRKYRRGLEKLYEDRTTIRRRMDVETPWGETRQEDVEIYKDQPCRISQKALGANKQTQVQNDIIYETKLFISPDIEILQGDRVEIIRGRLIQGYTAGEPFFYPTHQEISLQRNDKA